MIWLFISGLLIPFIFYFSDLLGNNFDAHFSKETLNKLRVKDSSFLRKIIPLKEGKIERNGQICGFRYYLYPRVLALYIQTIIILIGLILITINYILFPFIPDYIFGVLGGVLLGIWIVYTLLMCILSQGFHV